MSDEGLGHYVTLGSRGKAPVVILHGWQQSLESLRALGELLQENREIHLLDLPGFGKTPPPEKVWGTADYAAWVARYLERNELKSVDFIGHSFGGKVSLALASERPELVGRLVLIGASGLRPRVGFRRRVRLWSLGALRSIIRFGGTNLGRRIYEDWYIPKFASRDYKSAGPMRATFVKTVNEDLSQCLPRISAATLLLWGEEDEESPLSTGERMEKLLPDAKLVALPGKDHFPFVGPGGHVCAAQIKRFWEVGQSDRTKEKGE